MEEEEEEEEKEEEEEEEEEGESGSTDEAHGSQAVPKWRCRCGATNILKREQCHLCFAGKPSGGGAAGAAPPAKKKAKIGKK